MQTVRMTLCAVYIRRGGFYSEGREKIEKGDLHSEIIAAPVFNNLPDLFCGIRLSIQHYFHGFSWMRHVSGELCPGFTACAPFVTL